MPDLVLAWAQRSPSMLSVTATARSAVLGFLRIQSENNLSIPADPSCTVAMLHAMGKADGTGRCHERRREIRKNRNFLSSEVRQMESQSAANTPRLSLNIEL